VRNTSATPFPEIRALPPDVFERQLDWLQAHYVLVGLPELEAAVAGTVRLPENAAHLTFDDGFVDHFTTVFPILRRRGLSGTFFVAQDTCGRFPRLLDVHKTHFLLAALGAEAFGRGVLEAASAARPNPGADVFGVDRWEAADERAIKRLLNYELSFEDSARALDTLFQSHLGDQAVFVRLPHTVTSHAGAPAARRAAPRTAGRRGMAPVAHRAAHGVVLLSVGRARHLHRRDGAAAWGDRLLRRVQHGAAGC
jgi:peptidoglycan/xylan/chitin deacetylase (PgdA/CDA1 family)